jgi:RNA polymerase sigma factor (sigma-70 family)
MDGPIDAEQLGRLLDEHGPALALYAAQWTDSPDDCVQEALVELAKQRPLPDHMLAWLYRVVKHRALNAARGDRRRRERESRAIAERFSETEKPVVFNSDEATAATDALVQLELSERELVVMRIWGNLTYEEIGEALNFSTATAYRQYERALTKLRNILESPCTTNKNRANLQ